MEVTEPTFEEHMLVRNHIIVCGMHSSIKNFIMPLRARYLQTYQIQTIVIITGEPDERNGSLIDPSIWNSISRFTQIFLVNGSPLKRDTLLKANVNYADKVVILGHDSTLMHVPDAREEYIDNEVLYIYKAVKKCNKDVQVIIELVYSPNIELLLPQTQKFSDYTKSTLFAAGEVYTSAIIDTLTCQSYFNKHIVTILQ